MKKILILMLAITSLTVFGQVGIGTASPHGSAMLDVESSTKGLLIPRMTTAQRDAIASPATGLMVYNTTLSCLQVNDGTEATPVWNCISGVANTSDPSSNGTAVVSNYGNSTCDNPSSGTINGTMTQGVAVSGVTMTLYANVTTIGSWSLSATENGVTFSGSGNFTTTGCQMITLTAAGTPTASGPYTWTTNSTPAGSGTATVAAATDPSSSCVVKINATDYKEFLCHNLGANTALDPHDMAQTNAWGLNGAYIQWGRRGPNTTGDSRVDWVTATNTSNFAAAPTGSTAGTANSGFISGWSATAAANNSWRTIGGAKTANDPCPAGWRVPTSAEWTGVNNNNTVSRSGAWTTSFTYYNSALHYGPNASTKLLTLPAAGYRSFTNGALVNRGSFGYYWSSTEISTNSYYLNFDSSDVNPANINNRTLTFSLRCIAE